MSLDKYGAAKKRMWQIIFRQIVSSKLMISERRHTICHLRILTPLV